MTVNNWFLKINMAGFEFVENLLSSVTCSINILEQNVSAVLDFHKKTFLL